MGGLGVWVGDISVIPQAQGQRLATLIPFLVIYLSDLDIYIEQADKARR